jgi:hypothetical protein
MSDLHVLDGSGSAVHVACHIPIPAGNNLIGVGYQVAWVNSGRAVASAMPIGTGAGQIAQAEANALTAGTLAEIVLEMQPEAVTTGPARIAMLRELWGQAQDRLTADLRALRYYGFTAARA